MIRYFVAEDQPLILQDLTAMIGHVRPDLQLCGTALNGKDALEKILDTEPDLVFTDIKMPHLSGLEMMRQVRETHPRSKFVIISGYHDYEYMHEALRLEADEYLLKPISQTDIANVINSICDKLLQSQKKFEYSSIGKLLFSSSHDEAASDFDTSCQVFQIYLLNAGPCATYGIDYLNPFAGFWETLDVQPLCAGMLSEPEFVYCYNGKAANEKILVFGLQKSSAKIREKLCPRLLQTAEERKIPLTIGVSRDITSLSSIGLESQVVRTLMRKNAVFGKSSVLLCGDPSLIFRAQRSGLTLPGKKQLLYSIENHNVNTLRQGLHDILLYAMQKDFTQTELQRLLSSAMSLCMDNSNQTAKEDSQLSLEEALCNAKDYLQLETSVMPVFEFYATCQSDLRGDVSAGRLLAAKKYIDEHFQDNITVNEIACRFHIAPSYFSKMFKKEFSVTAIEYLTNCRIEYAKKLLRQGSCPVREVAELCGYTDAGYFSRIFKEVTGVPPSAFLS